MLNNRAQGNLKLIICTVVNVLITSIMGKEFNKKANMS